LEHPAESCISFYVNNYKLIVPYLTYDDHSSIELRSIIFCMFSKLLTVMQMLKKS